MSKHFYISIFKSFIRLAGAIAAMCTCPKDILVSVLWLCISLLVAEVLGIVEELGEK